MKKFFPLLNSFLLVALAWSFPIKPQAKTLPSTFSTNDIGTSSNTSSQLENAYKKVPYLPLGQPRTHKTSLAIAPILLSSAKSKDLQWVEKRFRQTLISNLSYTDLFRILPKKMFPKTISKEGIRLGTFAFSSWKPTQADLLLKTKLSLKKKTLILEAHVYHLKQFRELFGKTYKTFLPHIQTLTHRFSNDLLEALTGRPGIFLTKIAMVCDRTKHKELYVMNFDGTGVLQLTHHRSIVVGPAWHPKGDRLLYSLFVKPKHRPTRLNLYELNLRTRTTRLRLSRAGLNSGAQYHPTGNSIVLTMSFQGAPSVYLFQLRNKKLSRISSKTSMAVDPTWGPHGKWILYASDKTGHPMLYKIRPDGTQKTRLTFAGRYNASPSWSPQNNKITFAGWTQGHFDIFLMNPDGTQLERLTKDQGSNEDPDFSPDGQYVVFSSTRSGKSAIYVMNVDGTFVRRLTFGLGNCTSPSWSRTFTP